MALRSNDYGNSWYQTNNRDELVDLPLTKERANPIVETNLGRENVIWDLKYDKNYNPIIAYVEHAPFSNEGWDDNKANVITFDKKGKIKIEFLSNISSFVYPTGIRINPNNINNFLLGIKYKHKSKLVSFNNNSEYSKSSFFDIFNYSDNYEMNPIYPINTNGKYIVYMDVNKYFKKDYDSKIVLIENGLF